MKTKDPVEKNSTTKTKVKQQHIRHTVYYKNKEEKEKVEKAAIAKDITASKLIYKLLKDEGII
jgi:hypothetical protein